MPTSRSRRTLAALAVAAASVAATAPAASATIVWDAPAEASTLLGEWSGYQAMDPTRVQFLTAPAPVFQGSKSLRVETRANDTGPNVCGSYCERAEADGPFIHQEGDDDYTAVAFYIPTTYPSTTDTSFWQTSWQFFASPAGGSPPVEFGITPDAQTLGFAHNFWPGTNGVPSGSQTYRSILDVPADKGQWHKIIMHVKWSRYDNVGFVEIWHALKGQPLVKQTLKNGTTIETGATLLSGQTGAQPRASNYRKIGVLGTTQLYFDAVRNATTYAEAEAALADSPQYQQIENVASASNTTTGSSLSITKPAGTANGHAMVAAIENDGRTTITAPSGWTQVCQANSGNAPTSVHVFRKIAGASEPSSYGWTFSAAGKHAGGITTRSGVDTANPIMASSCVDAGDGNDMVAPSLTPTTPNALLVAGGLSTNGVTIGTPSVMAERFDVRTGTSGSDRAINLATEKLSGTAASGTRTFVDEVPSLGVTGIAAYSVLLRPATI